MHEETEETALEFCYSFMCNGAYSHCIPDLILFLVQQSEACPGCHADERDFI